MNDKIIHGHARINKKSPTYRSWRAMKDRCTNPNNSKWDDYGGRGISYDKRWEDFREFLADMGERPEGMTLDRVNNDLGYSKDNCRWTTHSVQMQNRRKWSDCSSNFHGVSWCKRANKWRATINYNKKQIHLGIFDSEEDAARSYDNAAISLFGPNALTNF